MIAGQNTQASSVGPGLAAPTLPRRRVKGSWIFHAIMAPVALLWVLPMLFVLFVAVRSFDDITGNGLGALPASFSFDGFVTVFTAGLVGEALVNSLIVTVFTVFLSLLLASWAAFALSRFHIPFRRGILLLMLAGNLLPPQILLIPVAFALLTDSGQPEYGVPLLIVVIVVLVLLFSPSSVRWLAADYAPDADEPVEPADSDRTPSKRPVKRKRKR